jgi:serine/threonine-protein kinase RsbW
MEDAPTPGPEGQGWTGATDGHTAPDLSLTLPARPEHVPLVRHLLGCLAESLGMPAHVCDDLRIAVTEACTNVVRHAYEAGTDGIFEVTARPGGEGLEVIVRDSGIGVLTTSPSPGAGLGLSLIHALSDEVAVERHPGVGSRLAMLFRMDRPITEAA